MCDKDNCNCGSNPCCDECEPWNCVEQAVNDVWATKETQIEGLVQKAENAADRSEDAASAAADSASEAKGYRDEAEQAATTAVAAEGTVIEVAGILQETGEALRRVANQLEDAIAGITVIPYYYTIETNQQTVIVLPAEFKTASVQAIYIDGLRQESGIDRGFTYVALTRTITLASGLPKGLEIVIMLGTYNADNPDDFSHTLASNNGASLVGSTSGKTVQAELDALKQASGNFSDALNPVWQRMSAESGYDLKGSFEDGAILTTTTDVIVFKGQGKLYKWTGTLPKTVAANSNPGNTGGITVTAWVQVDQETLRGQFKTTSGASLISTSVGKSIQTVLDESLAIYAESFGDLTTSDATSVLQTAINTAASKGLTLNFKTPTINCSQLLLPNNCILNLGNTVLKQIDNTNKTFVRNAVYSYTDKVYTNKNITIIDGVFDFNGIAQADTLPTGEVNTGCAFFGVDGLTFKGKTCFKNARRYNAFMANCTKVHFDTPQIQNNPAIPSQNKDGLHFCGKVYGVTINALYVLNPEDDALALNADDVDHGGEWTRANITGPIDNVWVGQVHVEGPASHNGVRLLSASPTTPITNVKIDSIVGTVDNYFLNIESYNLGTGSAYHNIDVGTVGGTYAVRTNPAFVQGMVNIYTMKSNGAVLNNIHIGQVFRDQVIGDGQERPTVQLGVERTSITLDEIVEQNCANDSVVRLTEVGPAAYVSIGKVFKSSTRTLTPGVYGSIVSASNVNANQLEYLKVGFSSVDHLRHVVLANSIKIKHLDMFSDGSADNVPLYLSSAQVVCLNWASSAPSTYQFTAMRYTLSGTNSSITVERPAVTGGSTAERPINALIGDSFYDTTLGVRVNWNGIAWV